MAITDTKQAKDFTAGAPKITLEGDLRPNQMMAGSSRYQIILDELINEMEEALGRPITNDEYDQLGKEAYEKLYESSISTEQNQMMASDGGRAQYGLGSFVKSIGKAVKGVAKGVKKVAKSPVGKAALTLAAAYYAPGIGIKAKFGSLPSFIQAAKAGIPNIFSRAPLDRLAFNASRVSGAQPTGILSSILSPKSEAGRFARNFVVGSLASGALAAAEAGGLDTSDPNAEIDVEALKSYLRTGYQNLNPGAQPEEVEEFVTANVAEYNSGGRVGLQGGGMDAREDDFGKEDLGPGFNGGDSTPFFNRPENIKSFAPVEDELSGLGGAIKSGLTNLATNKIAKELGIGSVVKSVPQIMAVMGLIKALQGRTNFASGTTITDYAKSMNKGRGPITLNDFIDVYKFAGYDSDTASVLGKKHYQTGIGQGASTQGFAMGGSTDDKVMAASGIEGLPININSKGIKELDLRETGGFIPPVGVKEKADDIPAMLSNNEFVFTADAVRAAGGGDVNKGAEIMYDTMKNLESRVA
jgi:hypothetical protein